MSTVDEVKAASDRFYSALSRMDVKELPEVWSHGDSVTAMHPMGGEQVGWQAVRESFEQTAGVAEDLQVTITDQLIEAGEDMAYEVGVERGRGRIGGEAITFEHRVTNVYRREGGQWKLVHHHTDISPAMVEILERSQAA
jgi:ketosteroid isomerase-like protein